MASQVVSIQSRRLRQDQVERLVLNRDHTNLGLRGRFGAPALWSTVESVVCLSARMTVKEVREVKADQIQMVIELAPGHHLGEWGLKVSNPRLRLKLQTGETVLIGQGGMAGQRGNP